MISLGKNILWNTPPLILDWYNETRLRKVAKHYNTTRGMVIPVSLEYISPGEVLNRNTYRSSLEVTTNKVKEW